MNDIKSLYLTAKASGKANNISAYTEAIHELLESNPSGYISNLEYIISSDIGLQTLSQFVEKNGLPISCHGEITSILEKCIEKCKTFKKDDTSFKEALANMESFRKKYIGCFMMESYFSDQLPENYVSVYYGSNSKGISNRKLMAGLLEKFGEAAIPDILITADNISHNSLKTAIQFIESHQRYGNPAICEWVLEAVKNISPDIGAELIALESKSIGRISYMASNRNHQLYREAVISGNDQIMMEYSENEVKSILDFISFNEYKLTWADELGLSVDALQESIYKLYEEVEGIPELTEDVATSVIPMIPSNGNVEPIKEGQWILNTRNKKTGDIPGYIKRNHKLDYGENPSSTGSNDVFDNSDKSSEILSEPSLDDFKRPSVDDMAQSYSGLDDEPEKTPTTDVPMTQAERNANNNYYYYTYNNSHNKNSGSFNRDNSHHDDHSATTKKTVDDHSYGKRINSDDNITKDNVSDTDSEEEHHTEAVGDADTNRPESDHPVKDIMTDIDRNLVKKQQSAKKVVQNVQNTGRAFAKPVVRTQQWISNMVGNWKDTDENNIKERMADPHARSRLFSVIKTAITGGSLLKAGLLLNPIFLFLTATRGIGKNKREFRIRNEMIGELKTELDVIDEKIKDADRVGDNPAKYKLMRFKNELNKKLLRVGGPKGWSKII